MSKTNTLDDLREPLEIHQVDFRIQSISAKGWALILAYKDARVDMQRLNDVLGIGNWQRRHDVIDGQLFCSVGVRNEHGEWAWVQDVGTESNTEKEKGRASDSFKRACFNLGIGMELYDYPLLLVQLKSNEYTVDGNKGKQTWDLKLRDWVWYMERDENSVSFLAAKDQNNDIRFKYGRRKGEEE